ncbi:MAG TPA: outer membrane beta-barrel protein [Gemmatimonadales bacterium]|nr:outer membrane beta-barrel protein [Gemmatimonadales bacterium]
MRGNPRRPACALLVVALIASGSLAAQGVSAASGDSSVKADPVDHLGTTVAGFKLAGFAEGSYAYSGRSVGDTAIVGRLYDRRQNRFTLNALAVVLDKPYDPAKVSAGFHTEVLVGEDAAVIQSNGFSLGPQGDIPHFYLTLNIPTASGNGLQFKIGRIPTLMGLEVIETYANPNWSEGNQFVYVENFTGTGVSIETKFGSSVDAQLRVFNGWDQVADNNTRKSLMGRVGIYPNALTSLGLVGFWGPEETGNDAADRYGLEGLVWRKLGRAAVWVQGDYGREQANAALPDPSRDATWWALGGWVTYDFTATVAVALRGDYVDDENGARSAMNSVGVGFPQSLGQKFGSATLTVNVRSWPGAVVRPEVRYDRSTMAAFNGQKDQVTVAIGVAYLY